LKRFAANPIFRGIRWSGNFLLDEAKRMTPCSPGPNCSPNTASNSI
jgi:hypothetical protein